MPRTDHVTILLASYQGAAYLPRQLASIAAQSHSDWSLIVGDDGSTDGTAEILQEFAASQPAGRVRLIDGPRTGATGNFLRLLEIAPSDTAIALCDQDDEWLPDKLHNAVEFLAQTDRPAHYAARTVICDNNLTPLAESRRFHRPLAFPNALVQACMAGNTSVFNAGAAGILKAALPAAKSAEILSHDWWAYQLTSGAGATIYHDSRPALYYRQHDRSEVGRNDTIPAMVARVSKLFAGDFGEWLARNHQALDASRMLLTAENRDLLERFGEILTMRGPKAGKHIARLGLYRQTITGTAALIVAAFAGRLRTSPTERPLGSQGD